MALDNALVFESLPTSGLANQLRGLTSAILLAQDLDRDFYLSWNKHQDMPDTSLSDLFTEPVLPTTSITGDSFSWLQRRRFVHRDREISSLRDRLERFLRPHHQFNHLGVDMVANALRPSEPMILLSSYYSYSRQTISDLRFYQRRHALYQDFIPVPEVQTAIQTFTEEAFGPHTLGIHLRTGISMRNAEKGIADANHFWPNGIPFELFFELIDDEIASHPDTRVLLASDNVKESAPITDRYADRIVMYPKKTDDGMVGRSALADQKSALIDLFLLSRCQKIIGTYNSTFSYEAAVIGDVPFVEMSPMGLRQQQALGNNETALVDFRDTTLCALAHTWKADDKARAQASSSRQNRSLADFDQQLSRTAKAVVVDCHGETGRYSLLARHAPKSLFYTFESDPDRIPLLMANMALNNLESRVFIVPSGDEGWAPRSALKTPTLDELVDAEKLETVTLIRGRADSTIEKMLQGASRTLTRFAPRIWLENTTRPGLPDPKEQARLEALPELNAYQVSTTDSGDFLCVAQDSA